MAASMVHRRQHGVSRTADLLIALTLLLTGSSRSSLYFHHLTTTETTVEATSENEDEDENENEDEDENENENEDEDENEDENEDEDEDENEDEDEDEATTAPTTEATTTPATEPTSEATSEDEDEDENEDEATSEDEDEDENEDEATTTPTTEATSEDEDEDENEDEATTEAVTEASVEATVEALTAKARGVLGRRLQRGGLQGQNLAVAKALLLGERGDISAATRRAFRAAGVSHLLAISGLHLGVLFGLLLVLLRHTATPRWCRAVCLLTLCWCYVGLVGAPVSVVRAGVMLTVLTIVDTYGGRHSSLESLGLSACCILLCWPAMLWSISFQLSFAAVLSILLCPVPDTLRERCPRWLAGAVGLLWVSLWAQLGTLPLCAWHFHSIALLGTPLSVVLIPLTTLILYGTLLLALLPYTPIGWVVSVCLSVQRWLVEGVASLPYATVQDFHPAWWQVVLVYLILLMQRARRR